MPRSLQMGLPMKPLLFACLSSLALAACSSGLVPREAARSTSEAYTEHPLSGNRYRVEYRVERGDYRRAYDLALRRAAQIALQQGYPAFEIVTRDSAMDVSAKTSAALAYERGQSPPRACGLLGCPKPALPMEQTSPAVSLEILLTRDTPNRTANRYDAAEVVGAIGSRARG